MKFLVFVCAAVALASAKPDGVPLLYSAGILGYPIATQYHAQDVLGQASYGHISGLQAHHAVQDAAGNKVGSYSHVAPNGQIIRTNYVADTQGYRAVSNGLPVGIQETPEVVAARKAHLAEVEAVKSRSRRAAQVYDTPASTSRLIIPTVPIVRTAIAHHPVSGYSLPFYQHVIAKREAQTPASTTPLKFVPQVPVVTPHVVPHVVPHPVVTYSYPHIIAKREAEPQTPASTTHLKVVPQVPVVTPHVVPHVVPHPVVTYSYPHIISKREAEPQTPASTTHLKVVPQVPVVTPRVVPHPVLTYSYPHIIAKREAEPQTPASTTPLKFVPQVPFVTPHVVPYSVAAYNYPHVIAKRAAQADTPAHTARLPAAQFVSPAVIPSIHNVHPIFGLYNPLVVN